MSYKAEPLIEKLKEIKEGLKKIEIPREEIEENKVKTIPSDSNKAKQAKIRKASDWENEIDEAYKKSMKTKEKVLIFEQKSLLRKLSKIFNGFIFMNPEDSKFEFKNKLSLIECKKLVDTRIKILFTR